MTRTLSGINYTLDVFAFQFAAVFVQEMLFAGEEGGEEIKSSINQV